ncbi:tetratricopeptide repeat protein [Pedobacter sp. AW1-32]|uniref:tetratricopeptide repeat protein n=1 Tax=Pedobacter sp. AW1-32 TaxID=3383026 RepID=UPI003FEFEE23
MSRIRLLFLFISINLPTALFANFDFNTNCQNAYRSIFELKLGNAKAYINTEKKAHPDNSMIPLLENYVDYFTLLTSNSKDDFDRLKANKSIRLDKIGNGDKSSPYYLFAQAEINLQWALIRSRFGEFFNAAMEIRRANNLLKDNTKKFPDFLLNFKGLALINAVLGNLPDGALKTALATFGFKGNMQSGLDMFEKLTNELPKSQYSAFYNETVFYYLYVLTDVAHDDSSFAKTMKYTDHISDTSLLKSYLKAYVSVKTGHSDEAIAILSRKPESTVYQPYPYLDYLEGIARLNKLEPSAAACFNRFLQNTKGTDYIKDANLHLGWLSLINGNKTAYNTFIDRVKSKGYTYAERDKQALNEANDDAPNVALLKARLLADGGYMEKAEQSLSTKSINSFSTQKDKTEFNYRMARIKDALGQFDAALIYYQQTINAGKSLKYYFAANAALQMGRIYERKQNIAKAKASYTLAIAMKNHQYESSIESEAKTAIKRLNN